MGTLMGVALVLKELSYLLGIHMGVMIFYTRVDGTQWILGVWVTQARPTYNMQNQPHPCYLTSHNICCTTQGLYIPIYLGWCQVVIA